MNRLLPVALLAAVVCAHAEPQPGDVWREISWSGPHRNADGWQRVTDPDAPDRRAQVYVPNPINKKQLEDVEEAIRAEIYIEYWGGHAGTSAKAVRVNGGPWHSLPRLEAIPGDAGRLPNWAAECYQHYSYATVPVPLDELHAGENTFEFDAGPQICHNFGWGQWGVYSVTFRLYYDPATRPHPSGRIISPASADVVTDSVSFEAQATSAGGIVEAVDFIGLYEDYDYEGNGLWRQWHYFYRYGRIKRHIGTVEDAPFRTTWDTRWVPDQSEPMSVVARIRDSTGLIYLTEPITDLKLQRRQRSVRMYKPYRVPTNWVSRAGRFRAADVFVPEDLGHAVAARMVLTTWSGGHADSVGINRRRILGKAGPVHDYGYLAPEFPLQYLQPGTNTFFTASETEHHGIEVMWPGIVLFIEYDRQFEAPDMARTDLEIFTDHLHTGWSTSTPEDGHVESGEALRIGVSSSFRDFFQLQGQPVPLAGYRALRFDLHPGDLRIASYNSLALVVWDEETPLMIRGEGQRGLDFDRAEWQTVEIPLSELYFRQPYFESFGLRGRLTGDLRIDNVRLVAGIGTAVEMSTADPQAFRLEPAFPNPFNATVTLPLVVPSEGSAEVTVYNLAGQRTASLLRGTLVAGHHIVRWSGEDDDGQPVASGVYLVRARHADTVLMHRVLLLR